MSKAKTGADNKKRVRSDESDEDIRISSAYEVRAKRKQQNCIASARSRYYKQALTLAAYAPEEWRSFIMGLTPLPELDVVVQRDVYKKALSSSSRTINDYINKAQYTEAIASLRSFIYTPGYSNAFLIEKMMSFQGRYVPGPTTAASSGGYLLTDIVPDADLADALQSTSPLLSAQPIASSEASSSSSSSDRLSPDPDTSDSSWLKRIKSEGVSSPKSRS